MTEVLHPCLRPCHVAARLGSLEMVQLLHSYGADLTLTSALGAHPSHEAAAHGHHGEC